MNQTITSSDPLQIQCATEPAAVEDALALDLWLSRGVDAVSSDTFKRRVLSRYVGVVPHALQFEIGKSGKPGLANLRTPCEFNVSHSGGRILCGVTRGASVGVDVEDTAHPRDVMRLARRFYSDGEVAELELLPEKAQRDLFYDLWTLKESAVKARGEALAPGLKEWSFRLSAGESAQALGTIERSRKIEGPGKTEGPGRTAEPSEIASLSARESGGAHYRLFDLLPDCRVAICWHGAQGQIPLVRFLADSSAKLPEAQWVLRAASRP